MPEPQISMADLFADDNKDTFELPFPGRMVVSFTTTLADGTPVTNRKTGAEEPSYKSFMIYLMDENGAKRLIYCSWANSGSGYVGGFKRPIWEKIVKAFEAQAQTEAETIPATTTADAAKAAGDQEEFPD